MERPSTWTARLLVVEDDRLTGEHLVRGLREAGFVPVLARDGVQGLALALAEPFDLAVVDVMLPGRSGLELVAELRRTGRRLPVLFLSARDQVEDRVVGLELGGDDYLVKPFAFAELLARVRSLLRRGTAPPSRLAAADLELDLVARRAIRAGRRLPLSPLEFRLLAVLLTHRGEILPRSLLLARVWELDFDPGTNLVEVAVRRLRAKVDEGFHPPLVHTVRGLGYCLAECPP